MDSIDYGYKTTWRTQDYHLVTGKVGIDRTNLYVERNDNQKFKLVEKIDRHAAKINKFSDRVPIASNKYPPHEERFENIDKSPSCLSMNKHIRGVSFQKYTKRNLKQTLFPFDGYKIDYDNYVVSKDSTMKKLNKVAIQMSKSAGRVSYRSHIPKKTIINESVDPQKAFLAKRDFVNGTKREIMLSHMAVTIPRDEKMYDFTDLRTNIHLDNTRDEREEEQNRKNEDRLNRMRLHT